MAHLTGFILENFRIFKDKTKFEFAPINILIGTNSSGKSSLLKGILLFSENFKNKRFPSSLSFRHETHKFGGFEYVLNNPDNPSITVGIPFKFPFPVFSEDKNEEWELLLTYDKLMDPESSEPKLSRLTILESISGETLIEMNYNKEGLSNNPDFYDPQPFVFPKINLERLRFICNKLHFKEERNERGFLTFQMDEMPEWYMKKLGNSDAQLIFPEDFFEQDYMEGVNLPIVKSRVVGFNTTLIEDQSETIFKYLPKDEESVIDDETLNELKEIEEQAFLNLSNGESSFNGWQEYLQILTKHADILGFFSFKNWEFKQDETKPLELCKNFSLVDNDHCPTIFEHLIYDVYCYCLATTVKDKITLDYNALNPSKYLENRGNIIPSQIKKYEDFLSQLMKFYQSYLGKVFSYLKYIPSSRVSQSRIYNMNNTSNTLASIAGRITEQGLNSESIEIQFLNNWLRKLELGDEFKIEIIEGTSARILIKKDGKDYNLTDQGYGSSQILSVLLEIILLARENYSEYLSRISYLETIMLIEEPEANLHPALQSKLADMFVDAANKFRIQFIIETHSEYLIRKLQYLTKKKVLKPEDTQIFYFSNQVDESENGSIISEINIQEDGRLTKEFGPGFYDESTRLMMALVTGENLN